VYSVHLLAFTASAQPAALAPVGAALASRFARLPGIWPH